ncbi:MAG: universal stress protein [Flavobacteriia bacterium]|nr:universal stress protein [Flavobacteriia bacterium]OIP46412.1 MAG: universal stress protein UspA [Flavobacteriaceae bacterium CG2_30_31_66]PIV96522.1 MAG: universal stress protein UspA [Flavobacteriaceae bacterium CG17_big_fil_post_rev_8_21_14_2_50_31_13]PIX12415.1 MAG: universal stress protein UspA [Flavobacteriaceae bacterium CG_4_8_14_3_um_filter_31_8]PIY16044.1 MAG: universal stress protein UspA [Flavobacteriaceae bacterium CG_4_10_14_3_um_filter_31_253]PIZ09893.1 MAG: universal stress 
MHHILVPIGSTESAHNNLQYAIDFAAEIKAKLFVFRAYSSYAKAGTMINIDSIIERETNLYIKTLLNTVDTKNVDVKIISAKGNVIESVLSIDEEIGIDLIILGAKSNSIRQEIFLGKTAGSLVKQTDLPMLAIPEGYKFIPIKNILMAFKSGIVKKRASLKPLEFMIEKFESKLDVLLVKTPNYTEEDLQLDKTVDKLKSSLTITENATTFQGVLEHINSYNPDLLCVFRRKRGFFKKLWEKSTILKSEFYTNVPLLIIKGK